MVLNSGLEKICIVELSANEMLAVFGGAGSVPTRTDPGRCPDGMEVKSATYNSAGELTSLVCEPTNRTQSLQESTSLVGQAIDIAKDAWDAVSGWF